MTNFTSKQVLMQSGVAMLAQANQLPQNLLRLLQLARLGLMIAEARAAAPSRLSRAGILDNRDVCHDWRSVRRAQPAIMERARAPPGAVGTGHPPCATRASQRPSRRRRDRAGASDRPGAGARPGGGRLKALLTDPSMHVSTVQDASDRAHGAARDTRPPAK